MSPQAARAGGFQGGAQTRAVEAPPWALLARAGMAAITWTRKAKTRRRRVIKRGHCSGRKDNTGALYVSATDREPCRGPEGGR